MKTIDAEMLKKNHAGFKSAISDLDRDIAELNQMLEQKKRNRIATDGARQAIEELIREVETPAAATPAAPATPAATL